MSRLITIIGDANIRRNMTGLNMASRDAMKTSQVLACDNLASLDTALTEVRAESSVCIVAAITDMLLAADDTGTIASSIESVLLSFKSKVLSLCAARPNLIVAVAPPLYRNRPLWYQKYLPQISGLFSTILSNDHPATFGLLPSFCSQETLPDGVYLTPVSGDRSKRRRKSSSSDAPKRRRSTKKSRRKSSRKSSRRTPSSSSSTSSGGSTSGSSESRHER